MMRLKNAIYVLLLIFLFIQVLIIFPQKLEKKISSDSSPEVSFDTKKPQQKMQGVHLVESEKGQRDWELFAEDAVGEQGKSIWTLRRVKVLFYKKNSIQFTVTGDYGSIDNVTKDIDFRGNVVTVSENGYTFLTEQVSYFAKDRQIISPDKVQVLGPANSAMKFTGEQMLVLIDQSKMFVQNNVQSEKKMDDNETVKIESKKVQLSSLSNKVEFSEEVKIDYKNMIITGPLAEFNLDANNDKLQNIQVRDGAFVKELEREAKADQLYVDVIKNQLTFTGSPKVIQDQDILTGEQIVFVDGGKKVKVQNVKATLEKK